MTSSPLENLAGIGQLTAEPGSQSEFDGLVRSGLVRLRDSESEALSLESRFDLAYNAAHALSLAALRWHGYRSANRYVVFQVLQHTLEVEPKDWRVLEQAHRKRNLAEYEGIIDIDEALVLATIRVARRIVERVQSLPPLSED